MLIDRLTENLANVKGITLYGICAPRTPTLIFNKSGIASEDLAKQLNEKGICVRGGFHCAPIAHASLKTGEYGAVRASLSFKNTPAEADAFALAVERL